MSGVPYTFASATSSIPLSELDSNFATPVTIGTTSVTLGNTVTTLANVSLSNVTISSVASVIPNNFVANSSVIVNGTSNVAIASANGAVTMVTNGNTAVTIDTAQNVGIGVTPSAWSGFTALQITNGVGLSGSNGSSNTQLTSNAYYNGSAWTYIASAYATKYTQVSGQHQWFNAPSSTGAITFTQAMTLDASGFLFLNRTSAAGNTFLSIDANLASQNCASFKDTGTTYGTGSTYIIFTNSSGAVSGSIQHTAASVVVYNTVSDERLKENIVASPVALDKVLKIPVKSYDWKEDNYHVEFGFVAQELNEIYSEAVSVGGEDEKENPWGIEYGRMTPILVKAIQELSAQVTTLQTQVTALKG